MAHETFVTACSTQQLLNTNIEEHPAVLLTNIDSQQHLT